ncbi:MAG TPA: CHAD domain-containing protein [Segetibacter sp.]
MAKTKKIQKFLNNQWNEMKNNVDVFCITRDKDKLHALRVNAKKIKAVVSLLNACSNNKKIVLKKLKELFDHAGKIRTAQLNVEALHEHHIQNEELEKEQNQIIERESDELCKRKKLYNRNIKKLKKSLAVYSFKIKNKSIVSYYHDSLSQLTSNFLPPIAEDNLHDNRKIIKRLLFALKILPGLLTDQININKQYIDNLQDLIGKWHDTIIAADMLGKDNSEYKALNDKKQMQLEEIENLTASFDEKVKASTQE